MTSWDTKAAIILPDAKAEDIKACLAAQEIDAEVCQDGPNAMFEAVSGTYEISYAPTVPCRKIYNIDSTWEELNANPKTREILQNEYRDLNDHIPFVKELCTLEEFTWGPFTSATKEQREKIDKLLREVE